MKKLYALKTDTNTKTIKLVVFAVLLISTIFNSFGQLRVPFAPRTAAASPLKTVYNIKGDFTMVGNTNLTLVNYSNTGDNADAMKYVDIDGDSNTWNSSSATLAFSTENGAIPACSQILYAGLYWTGRASDNSTNPHTFSVTKNGDTKTFDKRKVLLKGPGGSYEPIVSNTTAIINKNIYIPDGSTDLGMYSSYADVTDYVQTHGLGEYFVADIALREGSTASGIGLYGGWGMVVVYENSKMKYRNVTVFDGHAFVSNAITANFTFDVAGFNAVQSGNVNIKLGLMAGEGDERYNGDYFEIQRQDNGLYQRLSHSTTTTGNFFNSSINTGGNTRNPNFQNNTGLDIAMFNVPNPSNGIITNNQTSTRFRYGSTIDTYCIFNVTFSVDAYIPDTEGVLSTTSINGDPNPSTQSLEPGQSAGYKIEIRNKGTEATNNTIITIPIPDNVNTSNLNIVSTVYTPLTTTNVPVLNPPNVTYPNGYITWNLGTLPVPTNPDTVLADISFSLTVTTDCTTLLDPSFDPNIALYGSIKGTGAISNINFDKNLILGYQTTGLCTGEPIPIPSLVAINYLNYTNQPPTASNPATINVQCKADVPAPDILVVTDEADNSGIAPIVTFISDVSDNGVKPEIITRTYRVTDDCGNSINVQQTITINDTQLPTITCPANITVNPDAGQSTASGVNLGTPTTADNCSVLPATNNAPVTFPIGDTIVTWTVKDTAGNEATCVQTVSVTDNENPTIACPANIAQNVNVGVNGATVTYVTPTFNDNAPGATISQTAGLASGALFPIGTTTNTFVVTDASGNTATCSFTVTISDNENPTIACPGNIAQNVDTGVAGAVVTYTVNFTDNAPGATIIQTAGLASGATFPIGTTTNTFVVTDTSGNTATCSFTVTISDNENPTIACPGNIAQNVDTGVNGAVVTYTVNFTDNAPGATVVQTAGLASGATFPIGTTTNTFVVTDTSGNTATCSFTVTISDNENPTIACPGNIAQNVDTGVNGAVVTYTVNFTDNAPGATVVQTAGLASGATFPIGTTTNTFVVTDASGNTATCSFTVTISDNENPTIACPGNIAQNVDTGVNGAVVTYTVNFTDNAPGATVVQTAGLASGATFPIGTTTNTFVVTDTSGNTATCSFTVTISDNENPTIACPGNIAQNVDTGVNGAVVTYTVNFTDNAPGATILQTAGLASGSVFPIGTTTNAFVVTDASGNTATCSFIVTISDNENPTIVCPGDIAQNVDTGVAGAVVTYTVNFTDNAPGASVVQTAGLASGATFPIGTTTNTFVVTDASGNTATCSFTVTISDNENPTIACPGNIAQNVDTGVNGAVITYTVNFTDNAPGATVVQTAGLASGATFPIGTTTNTFVVTDASGNTATCSFTVTISDNENPTIACPGDIAQNVDTGVNGRVVTYTVNFTDNAPGATVVQTAGLASGATFPVGTTTNTFVVTDASGNTATCSFTVTISDNENPTIACPGNIAQNVDTGVNGAVVTYTVNFTDNAPGATVVQTAGLASGATFPIGTTTNTFVVTDVSGNTATCSFDVTITDNENPSIVCLPPVIQNVDLGICGAIVTYTTPVGTDNSTGSVTIQTDGLASGSLFPVGITTNTFVVTDASGNTATCSFIVTVVDNELPIITCPIDINQTADSGICGAAISIINPTASDNCSTIFTFIGVRSDNLALTDIYPVGTTTISWTAIDEANNVSLPCTQTINVTDNESPTFVEALPADITVECDQVPIAAILTAIDNCNSASVTFTEAVTTGSCVSNYTLTRTWTATDSSGNTTLHMQIVEVQDTIAPVLTLPANVSAECSDDLTPIAFGTATAVDNCDDNPIVTYNDVTTNGSCIGTFTITRTWTATDVCGNVATADQIISTSDTTAPEFVETTLPQDITIECNAIPVAETLTATDNCGTATVTVNDVRTNGNCDNNYIITRTWTATDECGLTNTHIQIITVQDTIPPTFVETLPPTNLVVECDAVPTAAIFTATDICGSATVTVNDVRTNGNCPNNYTLARTWTATDECGLKTSHTQIIVVRDTKAPKFVGSLPINVTVECDAIPNAQTITATDNCGSATVTVNDAITIGNCPSNYIIVRNYTATDECGLKTTHTQIITVQDTKAPVTTTTFDAVLNVSCTNIPDVPALIFKDNCSSNIKVVYNENNTFADNVYLDYEIVRTWTVTDECNNEAIFTQTLNVALDEVVTDIVAPDRCYDDGIVNLSDLISSDLNKDGTWELLEGDPTATLTGSIFNPTVLQLSKDFLPDDGGIDYKFRYTTTDNGCISITEMTMNINADCVVLPCGENDVIISKAVTPNGDSYNEFFEISGIELCGFRYDVKIFNRWGALIYESNNYQNNWNGTASKSSIGAAGKVPNGTYYYIVTLKDSGLRPFTGPVYLGTK